jgi:hypothetical protein
VVETAATQTKPASAGFKNLNFSLIRAGGLGFCSREFHSPGLELTAMDIIVPLQANLYGIQLKAARNIVSRIHTIW